MRWPSTSSPTERTPQRRHRLNNLAQLLQATNRLAEAEPLMRRALAIDEQSYGKEHPNVAIDLNNLAQLLQATNRLAEAEPLMRRALAIDEQSYGKEHPNVATRPQQPGAVAPGHEPAGGGRAADAPRPGHRRAVLRHGTPQRRHQPQQPGAVAPGHEPAGGGRAADAPRAGHRRAVLRHGPPQRRHETSTTWLQLLQATNRLAEAEPLMRRALAIDEQSYGTDHPNVAIDLNNLAAVAPGHEPAGGGRAADAPRAGHRRAVLRPGPPQRRHRPQQPGAVAPGHEPPGGGRAADAPRRWPSTSSPTATDHPNVAIDLNNLAQLLQATNRLAEAEPLIRRAVSIFRSLAKRPVTSIRIRGSLIENYRGLLQAMNLSQPEIEAKVLQRRGRTLRRVSRNSVELTVKP